ncbi:hypothetical protein [Rothia nasimurium]|nr:hypothetical protein [Rothia nasimurium]
MAKIAVICEGQASDRPYGVDILPVNSAILWWKFLQPPILPT